MLRPEYLAYFKDLFEGRAEVSWNAWFKLHESQLSQDLPRQAFLHLKFKKLDEAERYLKEFGVSFVPSPLIKRERYYAQLHPDVLDSNGRPKVEFQRQAYDGAVGCLLDGQIEKAKEILTSHICRIRKRPPMKQIEDLTDLCFDGEIEFRIGNKEIGRVLLELVASLDTDDDLLDPVVERARLVMRGE